MAKIDVKKLKTDAEKLRGKNKLDKALELYEQIDKAGQADAKTLQRMAEIYLKLEKSKEGIDKYRQAMNKYVEEGFLLQAIAVGKILQELVPENEALSEEIEKILAKTQGALIGRIQPKKMVLQKSAETSASPEPIPDGTSTAKAEAEPEERREEKTEAEAELETPVQEEPLELEEPALEEETIVQAGEEGTSSIDFLLFSELNQEEFSEVYRKLRSVKVPAGVRICREGESGDSIFIIVQGKVGVIKRVGEEEKALAQLGVGEFFGEFGYFMDGLRHATVKALTDLELLEISKSDMDQIIEQFPQVKEVMLKFYKERVLDNLLALSPLTSILSPEERKKLIDRFELRECEPGEVIVQEGEPGDAMFLIKSGRAEVTTIDPRDSRRLTLARLGAGDFFGEVSLIKNKPRTATITALTPMELLVITRESFEELSQNHPELVGLLEQTIEQRVEATIKKIMGEK